MTQRVPAGQGLSALQRDILEHILTGLSDRVKEGKKGDRIRWQPARFYKTGASRAVVSNSLRRLEERGLIVRRDAEGQRIDKGKQRTTYVSITGTGIALTMHAVFQRSIQASRARAKTLAESFVKLEDIPEEERFEKLKGLFRSSLLELEQALEVLEIANERSIE